MESSISVVLSFYSLVSCIISSSLSTLVFSILLPPHFTTLPLYNNSRSLKIFWLLLYKRSCYLEQRIQHFSSYSTLSGIPYPKLCNFVMLSVNSKESFRRTCRYTLDIRSKIQDYCIARPALLNWLVHGCL